MRAMTHICGRKLMIAISPMSLPSRARLPKPSPTSYKRSSRQRKRTQSSRHRLPMSPRSISTAAQKIFWTWAFLATQKRICSERPSCCIRLSGVTHPFSMRVVNSPTLMTRCTSLATTILPRDWPWRRRPLMRRFASARMLENHTLHGH